MKCRHNKLGVIERAVLVWQNPDDFIFGTFLCEEAETLDHAIVYILTGKKTYDGNREKILKFIEKKEREVLNGSESDNRTERVGEDGMVL